MAPCQNALLTKSGHGLDESMNGVLGDLPDLDQGISEILDSLLWYLFCSFSHKNSIMISSCWAADAIAQKPMCMPLLEALRPEHRHFSQCSAGTLYRTTIYMYLLIHISSTYKYLSVATSP